MEFRSKDEPSGGNNEIKYYNQQRVEDNYEFDFEGEGDEEQEQANFYHRVRTQETQQDSRLSKPPRGPKQQAMNETRTNFYNPHRENNRDTEQFNKSHTHFNISSLPKNLKGKLNMHSSIERSPLFRKRSVGRPRSYTRDADTLIHDKMLLKEANHKLKDENLKLKTKVQFLDKEIDRRDKFVESTINANKNSLRPKQTNIIIKTSLVNSLKRKYRECKEEMKSLQSELEKHNKDKKTTTIKELEANVQVLTDECTRLRNMLTEALK